MIDNISTVNTSEIWKNVDDTTIAEHVAKNQESTIRHSVNQLIVKSNNSKFQVNEPRCKEMRISFAKNDVDVVPVINKKAIEVVPSVKPLGLNISNDLKWNCHASEISRKVSTRLFFLKQLKRANVEIQDLVTFYVTCLRPSSNIPAPFPIAHYQTTSQIKSAGTPTEACHAHYLPIHNLPESFGANQSRNTV